MNPDKKQEFLDALAEYTAARKRLDEAWPLDQTGNPSDQAWRLMEEMHGYSVTLTAAKEAYYG
ncbi:hypothetical protein [Kitasatospora cineracea]|uniref:hypothetical protein n=1 Tax=Kitasatospora cineracea TaxID=88074 RepID=UPI00380F458F